MGDDEPDTQKQVIALGGDDDEFDDEGPCPECKGTGWITLFYSHAPCERCEQTGVDLVAAGYITAEDADTD